MALRIPTSLTRHTESASPIASTISATLPRPSLPSHTLGATRTTNLRAPSFRILSTRSRISSQNGIAGLRAFGSTGIRARQELKVRSKFEESALSGTSKHVDRAANGKRIMSSLTPYCLNVRVVIKPERKDEFLTVIKADQVGTLTDEVGALQFLIMQDNTNSNQFFFHEEYVNKDAFLAHTEAPHFKSWRDFTATDPFSEAIEVNQYEALEEVKSITKNDRTLEGNDGAGKFTVWVNLYPLESAISEFRGTIGVNKAGTDNKTLEPNAKQYTYGENVAAPNSFHFFEVYDDEAGFKVHAGAEHFLKWEAFAGTKPFGKDPVVYFGTIV